jgi:hypothetical protein
MFNATELRYSLPQLSCIITWKHDAAMSINIARLIKKNLPHRLANQGLLAWSARQRVLAVLPVLLLLWLAVAWAAQEALV